MIENILLDQDGVIADFWSAGLKVHNRMDLVSCWPEGQWAMEVPMGISVPEFWRPIDNYEFWRYTVRPFDRAREFYEELCQKATVTICTSPSESADCAKAKIEWLREHIDPKIRYMIGSAKHLMGKPSNLLIDDYDNNVNKFKQAGGMALLLPQVWNSHYCMAGDSAAVYAWMLEQVDGVLRV